jgi:anoctamin-1
VCVQFGFVSIFAVAYPLGAAFALLNNLTELRIDGHVLLTMTRRPRYSDAQSIGAWMSVLQCSA